MLPLSGIAALIPPWARWLALALVLCLGSYGLGRLQEARVGAAKLETYKSQQAAQTVKIVQAEAQVITKVETVYRDRIQKVYIKGAEIEKEVVKYVTVADDSRFGVNAGFVRSYDASWAGQPVGSASDSDREPAGIPLSVVAEADAFNATSCRAWRQQALGWRDFYAQQQQAVNKVTPSWYTPLEGEATEPIK